LRSMRDAHEAHVMPSIGSSMRSGAASVIASPGP
jgi:hypothetical protein